MTKEIFKRIFFTFLITAAFSMTYAWASYPKTVGLEEKQASFIVIILNLIFCTLSFILSLTALLNLNSSIRNNFWLSLISFIGLPCILLLILTIQYITNRNDNETIKDFFAAAHTSVIFCLILIFHFYKYRQTIRQMDT